MIKILVTPQSLDTNRHLLASLVPYADLVFGSCASQAAQDASYTCEAVILGNDIFDVETINRFQNLRLVVRFGTGINNVDVEYLRRKGIRFCTCENCAGQSIAMYVLTAALYFGRSLAKFCYQTNDPFKGAFIPKEPKEIKVGILGMGNTGTATAILMKRIGFQVSVCSRRQLQPICYEHGFEQVPISALLSYSDIISLHISANVETMGFLGRDRLNQIKRGATLINTARAEIVDEEALIELLDYEQIATYVSDLPFLNTRFNGHPKVFATPHIAGRSLSSIEMRAFYTTTFISDTFNFANGDN